MKRILALLLALVLTVSVAVLAGCSKEEPASDETTADVETAEEETETVEPSGPLTLTAFTAAVGEYELSFEPVDLGSLQGADGTYDFAGDFYDGKYYLSDVQGKLIYVYAIDGATATLENKFEMEDTYEKISVSPDGDVYLSPGIFEAVIMGEDGSVEETKFRHDVEWAQDEDFAITTWVNSDPTIIRDGEESEWVFKNLNDPETREGNLAMVFDCEIAGENIIIGGTFEENDEEDYRIGVFDFDGNQLALTDVEDSVGYPALNATENGIISANVHTIYLHDMDCKPLGELKNLRTLAGLDETVTTFWVKEFSVADDGSVYMLVYASKPDETCEALLYKVTGF